MPKPYSKRPCTRYSLYLDPNQQSWKQNSLHSTLCCHCLSLIKNLPVPCTPCTFIRVSNILIRVSNPGNKTLCIQLCVLTAISTVNITRLIDLEHSCCYGATNHWRMLSPGESSEIIKWCEGGGLSYGRGHIMAHIDYVR